MTNIKGTVFFYPGKSLTFDIFGQISDEWVTIVFFFHGCIFFSGSLRMSEWVKCELFLGKKKYKKMLEKKNTRPKFDNVRKLPNLPFFDLFLQILFFFEWVAFKLFLGKKKNTTLFFLAEKKNTKFSQIEWVSGVQTFPGKKKYDTFASRHK